MVLAEMDVARMHRADGEGEIYQCHGDWEVSFQPTTLPTPEGLFGVDHMATGRRPRDSEWLGRWGIGDRAWGG